MKTSTHTPSGRWRLFRQAAGRHFARHWRLSSRREEPAWIRLLITTGFGLTIGVALSVLSGSLGGDLGKPDWWAGSLPANLLLACCISYSFHAVYAAIEKLLPAERVDEMAGWRDWRAGLLHSAIGVVCVIVGAFIGLSLIDLIWQVHTLQSMLVWQFLAVSLLISALQWVFWKWRWKQKALQLSATEAQLKLLQAQIEPHFLFNTLANVQSLIDYDTPRAKQMLEAFTDYLRASLGRLRVEDSSLGAELEMAQAYLQLLQTRMGERLRFAIEVDEAARAAVLPPLLLQPLIENAIQHGLEPKIEGGSILVSATLQQGRRLQIRIADDGLGLDAPRRPGPRHGNKQAGAGIALDNIRARLATRYAEVASLRLEARSPGTVAILELPLILKKSP
ncbi:MAG: histidine kinase [Burkholderiaceae bacterium]